MSQIPTPEYPGIDLDANEGPYINSICIVFIALSLVTICLRMFSRWWTKIEVGQDDYLIIVSALFCWGFSAVVILEVQQNFYGQHIGKSDIPHTISFMKGLYALTILYPQALTWSKLSLLALYWRIFRSAGGKWPIILAASANVGWMVVVNFLGAFSCSPIRGFWDVTIKAKCLKYPAFYISSEAFTITLDIVVLIMPVYFIASINRSLSQRISISSTFLLGLIATIISCVRLALLIKDFKKPGFDPIFNNIAAGVWGVIEVNLWVVVSSIPTFRPLLGKILRDRKESKASGNSSRTYVNGSGSGLQAKFGRKSRPSRGTTLPSLDSQDHLNDENYDVLVKANSQNRESRNHSESTNYEMGNFHHGIQVDREVKVSASGRTFSK